VGHTAPLPSLALQARRLGHNFVGTEQLLLGMIGEGTGIAAKVLKS
jgi:ATP-dependent Clp protease ATP-binding subunit ClpC